MSRSPLWTRHSNYLERLHLSCRRRPLREELVLSGRVWPISLRSHRALLFYMSQARLSVPDHCSSLFDDDGAAAQLFFLVIAV